MENMTLTQEQAEQLKRFDAYLSERSQVNTLRERNIKVLKHQALNSPEMKEFRERTKKIGGFDAITDTDKFPAMKESFSWNKVRKILREADSETQFPLYVAAGLLQNVIGMYTLAKQSYMDWVTVTPTGLLDTPIAPLHGVSFPNQVGPETPYREVYAAGLSLKIRAYKYGSMYSVEKELLDDDQTGQFKMQGGMLGEYLQLLTEVLCYGKLQSVSNMSYQGYSVPVSETKPSYESNWPWTTSAATFRGGGYNRPTSFGTFNQANIQTGIESLMLQKNLLGIIMNVNPKRLLISPLFRFDAAIILNSSYYPSGAQSAGTTGGAFAINPLQGICDLTVSRYMPDNNGAFGNLAKTWFIVDDTKPWFQLLVRTPVSVEQENPLSGESFNRDIYRFKCSTRQNADFIDPRFAWKGNDGSV